jgi:hypothetical protein
VTAEIAILNRHAIAMAADSALTVGKKRVWKHANKLFSLGPVNDIAIMVYGEGQFCGYSWEILVKTFRDSIKSENFLTVRECAEEFMNYLSRDLFSHSRDEIPSSFLIFLDPLEYIKSNIDKNKPDKEKNKNIATICKSMMADLESFEQIDGCPDLDKFKEIYLDGIKSLSTEILGFKVSSSTINHISATLHSVFTRDRPSDFVTGVVFGGYGRDEYFPSLLEYYVDGKDNLLFRRWETERSRQHKNKYRGTQIVPFGQSDIFTLFMEGVSPETNEFVFMVMDKLLKAKSEQIVKNYVKDEDSRIVEMALQIKENEAALKSFSDDFMEFTRTNVVSPIIDVVRSLPKEEMAEMALALVDLTSLRRKVDSSLESVGGPVDVAVISKGDGLIWIKRKHYFDIDKNPDFLYRKKLKLD